MFFLLAIDFWLANVDTSQQPMPIETNTEVLIKKKPNTQEKFKIVPYVLEGTVDNFDAVARANSLAKTFPRQFCGTFNFFDNPSEMDAIVTFSSVQPVGQIITLKGDLLLQGTKIPLQGNLNAKSNHLEFLIFSEAKIAGQSLKGSFIGLQGMRLLGWQPSTFNNSGGKLNLNKICQEAVSKSPGFIGIF